MTRRAAIYTRVSTSGQTTENQTRELEAVAARNGWEVVQRYTDEGISGAKDRTGRAGLDAMWKGISRREFDVVMAWSTDRLGRNLKHLVELFDELQIKRVDLYLHQQGIDTSTPAGRAMFQMAGVFAEFERAMISERVKAGLSRVRSQGSKSGKPMGRPPVSDERMIEIRRLIAEGLGNNKICRAAKCGMHAVRRARAELSD